MLGAALTDEGLARAGIRTLGLWIDCSLSMSPRWPVLCSSFSVDGLPQCYFGQLQLVEPPPSSL